MYQIIQSLSNQAKTGAFRVSTVERAERYLAAHPFAEIGQQGQALRNLINIIRAEQKRIGL